jgi:MFS family permease
MQRENARILSETLDEIGWTKYHWLVFWLCGLGWAMDMLWIMSLSIVMHEVQDYWDISVGEASTILTSQMAGVFLGAYVWGWASDRIGRMFSFKRTLYLVVVGGLICVCSMNLWMLCIGEFIVGLGLGGEVPVDGCVFTEFCPPKHRNRITALSLFCDFSSIFGAFLAWMLSFSGDSDMWRIYIGTITGITLLVAVPRYKIKETPQFLLVRNRIKEAESTLKMLAEINNTSIREALIPNSTTNSESPKHSFLYEFKKLFQRNLRKTTSLLIIVWFLTAFCFGGFSLFMPELLKRSGAGDFSDSGKLYLTMVIQQSAGVPGVILSVYMVKSFLGRKWSQALALMLGGAVMNLFLIAQYATVLTSTFLFYFFSLMAYSVQYTITPESFPSEVRNTGVGVCSSANRLGALIAPSVSALLFSMSGGVFLPVVVYSVSLILAGVVAVFLRETKNANTDSQYHHEFEERSMTADSPFSKLNK